MTICWQSFHLDRRIPSDERASQAATEEILDQMRAGGWPETDIFNVHLALEEALVNAIEHGNGSDRTKTVAVTAEVGRLLVVVKIRDEGRGFDPAGVPDPTCGEFLCEPHGRGVLIMKRLMTSVRYNERGNEVTMEKRRTPSNS